MCCDFVTQAMSSILGKMSPPEKNRLARKEIDLGLIDSTSLVVHFGRKFSTNSKSWLFTMTMNMVVKLILLILVEVQVVNINQLLYKELILNQSGNPVE